MHHDKTAACDEQYLMIARQIAGVEAGQGLDSWQSEAGRRLKLYVAVPVWSKAAAVPFAVACGAMRN